MGTLFRRQSRASLTHGFAPFQSSAVASGALSCLTITALLNPGRITSTLDTAFDSLWPLNLPTLDLLSLNLAPFCVALS